MLDPWKMDERLSLPFYESDRNTTKVWVGDQFPVLEVPNWLISQWRLGEGGIFLSMARPLDEGDRWMKALYVNVTTHEG